MKTFFKSQDSRKEEVLCRACGFISFRHVSYRSWEMSYRSWDCQKWDERHQIMCSDRWRTNCAPPNGVHMRWALDASSCVAHQNDAPKWCTKWAIGGAPKYELVIVRHQNTRARLSCNTTPRARCWAQQAVPRIVQEKDEMCANEWKLSTNMGKWWVSERKTENLEKFSKNRKI